MPIRKKPDDDLPWNDPPKTKAAPVPATRPNGNTAVATRGRVSDSVDAFGAPKQSDLIMARLKLLQGMSPEVKQDPRTYIQGEFLHTGLGELLGMELKIIPVKQSKTYDLWADRDSNEGLLAQADENGEWLPGYADREFIINRRKVYTRRNLAESGLNTFGSSDPNNPRSKPMIAETYRLVLWLLEYPEASPVLFTTSRMGAQKVKEFITRIMYREGAGTPVHQQIFDMISASETYKGNTYFQAYFTPAGTAAAETGRELLGMARGLAGRRIVSEGEDSGEDRGPRAAVDARSSASY